MASTYSSNLKIELMGTGENAGTWGNITNTNLGTAYEQAVIGLGNPDYTSDANLTITLTDSNASQAARCLVLNVTSAFGSLTTTRELIVPTIQKQYIVQNNTTGGQSITVKTSAGTGITVPNGRKAHLYVNGTNVIQMFDFINVLGGTIDNATLGATTASSARVTTLNASGATTLDGTVALGNASGDLITVPGTVNSNLLFTDATYDIGASGATRPRDLFLSRNLTVGGTLTLAGGVNLNGNVTVGDSSADTLTINSTITSNLIFTDNTYDIGASGATRPRNLFLAGNITAGGNQTLTGALTVDSTTDSTSTTTGSIQTDGGVGIAKALFVGTTATVASLTSGRVTFAGASGLLTDSANLTFSGSALAVTGTISASAAAGAFTGLQVGTSNGVNSGLIIGNKSSGTGAIWSTSITPSAANYAFHSDGGQVAINASTSATLNVANSIVASATSTGLAVTGTLTSTGNATVGSSTSPSGRFAVVTSEAKTSGAIPMVFGTSTGGANDFQLIFSRSANGAGSYYKIQSVEQATGYRNLVLQSDGGVVGIGTSAPAYNLQVGALGGGTQPTIYVPGTFNWDGAYLQPATSAGRGAALILASHVNVTNSSGYRFSANNDVVARIMTLDYANDAASLSAASFSSKFWFDGNSASPAIGIGKAPSYPLDVAGTITGTGLNIFGVGADALFRRVEAQTYPFAQLMQKARGTPSSPSTVLNGDGVGVIYFQPFVATSGYIFPASIQGRVNGAVTGTAAPTDIIISTGTTSEVEAVRITSGQFVGIKTASPTNMLDVSGAIGKRYTSNVTVPNNNTSTAVLNPFNGQNFSNWLGTNFATGGPCTGTISITWDTGGSASSAIFTFAKHSGFDGVSVELQSSTNYNGDTTTSGGIISIRNNGGASLTPVFSVIVTTL